VSARAAEPRARRPGAHPAVRTTGAPVTDADDTWFALSKNGSYDSSADLTTFGKDVVENPTYGLLALAHPATIF
jgi:hypothetical protein